MRVISVQVTSGSPTQRIKLSLGDDVDLAVGVLAVLLDEFESFVGTDPCLAHQNAFGLLDDTPGLSDRGHRFVGQTVRIGVNRACQIDQHSPDTGSDPVLGVPVTCDQDLMVPALHVLQDQVARYRATMGGDVVPECLGLIPHLWADVGIAELVGRHDVTAFVPVNLVNLLTTPSGTTIATVECLAGLEPQRA
jgi:hypothetical protein